ncbi:hypothetical protein RO865_17705 [Blautia faecis]|uniref:hypothetical protein n=1 Tax=Blautia faecis TaxID=871665 RepID=UPI0028A4EE59|nr:hypothetical protein [Blautia faecis]MDT4370609.1 hypothetical protein [Blautia faecis]
MGCIYRYTDLSDDVIKYVGIIWSENRSLKQRIEEHYRQDEWCKNKEWKIEYIEENIKTRTDAEYLESHYIALFHTDNWYNKNKAGWGISNLLPDRDRWILYDEEKYKLIIENKKLKEENKALKKYIHYNTKQNIIISGTLPIWSEGTLFHTNESRKNNYKKSKDQIWTNGKINYFYKKYRISNDNKYCGLATPCKLFLYDHNLKIIEKRYFNSIKECANFTGLRTSDITKSMLCKNNSTYFYYKNGIINGSDFSRYGPLDIENYAIRVCGITPYNKNDDYFKNKKYRI